MEPRRFSRFRRSQGRTGGVRRRSSPSRAGSTLPTPPSSATRRTGRSVTRSSRSTGSILAVVGGWFAYQPSPKFQVGAGVQMLTGFLRTTVDFSACAPDHFMCAQEDPNYDALGKLSTNPIFAPSANAGMTWIPKHIVRIGVSGQAPFVVDSGATVDVRLPTAVFFDNAHQNGNSAHVHLDLPPDSARGRRAAAARVGRPSHRGRVRP